MIINKTLYIYLLVLVSLLSAAGCKQDGNASTPDTVDLLELSKSDLMMPGTDFTDKVPLKTSKNSVRVEVPEEAKSWLSASATPSEVTVTVKASDLLTERRAELKLSAGTARATLRVIQAPLGPSVVTSEKVVTIPGKSEGLFRIPIIANVPFIVEIPDDASWLIYKGEEVRTRTMIEVEKGERTLLFATTKNTSPDQSRKAIVNFRTKDEAKKIIGSFSVEQEPFGDYEGSYSDAIPEDIKHVPSGATASNPGQNPNDPKEGGIQLTYDGDYETIYHSTWNNKVPNYFPITVEYTFRDKPSMDYIVYHPRRAGNNNGNILEMDVYIKADGQSDYELVSHVKRDGSKDPTFIKLGKLRQQVEAVKFVIQSGVGDSKPGFVAISEMEFYEVNPEVSLPTHIFTDESFSELRSGVTEADIETIKSGLLHDIALHMLRGTYPREYRIADYRAWPHPDAQAKLNRTNSLSLLDNPTGITVRDKEELYVFVGDTHGYKVSLMLLNLDTPGDDGFNSRRQLPLHEGVNKLVMPSKGLLYVLYHTPEYKRAEPIRIHFATGTVQGYYDSTKDPVDKYQRLLEAAPQDGYFDIIGERAHLSFPVSSFRSYAPGAKGKQLIDLYDDMVRREETFQGHYKYGVANVNRAYFHVMYHSYMYATSYHTGYNVSTVSTVLDPDKFRESVWGPAHEMGHCFQVRPTFLWRGMTEVTNNMQSLNVQTSWTPEKSRIQDEDLRGEGGYVNRYDKAYSRNHIAQVPFCLTGDVFCQLVTFWQIQLYYARVKGYEDVYMDIYERMRTADYPMMKNTKGQGRATHPDNGQIQLNFYRDVSKIVGEDLTDFFDFWGFFKPCDELIDDYAKEQLRITPEMVEKVKAEVKAMALPKPTMEIQYICDANWTYYRDQKTVIKGSPARIEGGGQRLVVPEDWQYYVAIEVEDAQGKKIGIANNREVVIVAPATLTKECKAYAVAYDGKRTPIEIK